MSQGNKELRDLLFGGDSRKRVKFEVLGKEFELLEPTLSEVKAHEGKDNIDVLVMVAMNNVVTPGTTNKVFEPTDRSLLMNMGTSHPFIKALGDALPSFNPEEEDVKKQ